MVWKHFGQESQKIIKIKTAIEKSRIQATTYFLSVQRVAPKPIQLTATARATATATSTATATPSAKATDSSTANFPTMHWRLVCLDRNYFLLEPAQTPQKCLNLPTNKGFFVCLFFVIRSSAWSIPSVPSVPGPWRWHRKYPQDCRRISRIINWIGLGANSVKIHMLLWSLGVDVFKRSRLKRNKN